MVVDEFRSSQPLRGMRISDPLFLGFSVPYSSKYLLPKKGREIFCFIVF